MSPQTAQAAFLIALGVVFLAVAIWMFMRANRRTKVIRDEGAAKDVLDEGASPAARNQALIDAPAAVARDVGQTSANANSDAIAAATASADAEAGAAVTPTTAPPPAPAPAPTGEADDLKKIKGVGPKLVTMLKEQGITTYAQIAAWSDADIARIDETLGRFKGRIERDQWVEQAKLLVAGDEAGFTEKFGRDG
jgi:predicted flap endonuclease-1-like 5' DNA nuclease/cbb3-type cytochrome oxidase subunit 3